MKVSSNGVIPFENVITLVFRDYIAFQAYPLRLYDDLLCQLVFYSFDARVVYLYGNVAVFHADCI
jgi:hypothetical protein